MKIPRSQRLKIVLDLAHSKEQEVAGKLKVAGDKLAQEKEKLKDLERYYNDYQSGFACKTSGITSSQLSQSRIFLNRLADAKMGQDKQLIECAHVFEHWQGLWHKCHLKTKNIARLLEKYEREEQQIALKREQSDLDEWSNQRR